MRLGLGAVLAASLVGLVGCGGSLAKPVQNTIIVQRENGTNIDLIVTRKNTDASTPDSCTLERQRDWCSFGVSEIRFEINPSQTLYRAYIRNNGDTEQLVTAKVERDDGRSARTTVRIAPGQTVWAFELGVETVRIKSGV